MTVDQFWDLYERELILSVDADPASFALVAGETAESYARRVRVKFQAAAEAKGLGCIMLATPTFRRVAKHLGVAKFTQRDLRAAYVDCGGKL